MIKVQKDMHKANEMTEVHYFRAICKVTALRWFTVYIECCEYWYEFLFASPGAGFQRQI